MKLEDQRTYDLTSSDSGRILVALFFVKQK
jgi:hypothetical protein